MDSKALLDKLVKEMQQDNFDYITHLVSSENITILSENFILLNEDDDEEFEIDCPEKIESDLLALYCTRKYLSEYNNEQAEKKLNDIIFDDIHPLLQILYLSYKFSLNYRNWEQFENKVILNRLERIASDLKINYYSLRVRAMKGVYYQSIGDYPQSIETLERLLPEVQEYAPLIDYVKTNLIVSYISSSHYSKATTLLADIDDSVSSLQFKASTYFYQGYYDLALENLKKLINLKRQEPNRAEIELIPIQLIMIDGLMKQGDFSQAHQLLKKLEDKIPPQFSPEFNLYLARYDLAMNNNDSARRRLNKYKKKENEVINPRIQVMVRTLLAQSYISTDPNRAKKEFQAALESVDSFPPYVRLAILLELFDIQLQLEDVDDLTITIQQIEETVSHDLEGRSFEVGLRRAQLLIIEERYDESLDLLSSIITKAVKAEDFIIELRAEYERGRIHLFRERYKQAESSLLSVFSTLTRHRNDFLMFRVIYDLIHVYINQGNVKGITNLEKRLPDFVPTSTTPYLRELISLIQAVIDTQSSRWQIRLSASRTFEETMNTKVLPFKYRLDASLYLISNRIAELEITQAVATRNDIYRDLLRSSEKVSKTLIPQFNTVLKVQLKILDAHLALQLDLTSQTRDFFQQARELAGQDEDLNHFIRRWEEIIYSDDVGDRTLKILADDILSISGKLHAQQRIVDERSVFKRIKQQERLELLGQVVSSISHDFNNTMAIILGNIELANNLGISDHRLTKLLNTIATAGRQAVGLLNNISQFAKQREEKHTILDLKAVINDALELMEISLSKRVKLQVELPEKSPHIYGSELTISQALLNLAINSRDAGADTINLRLNTNEDHAYIIFGDNGGGMEVEVMNNIFEPFYTTKSEGSGLGLYNVQRNLESIGATISVNSKLNEGTTFSLKFPLIQNELRSFDPRKIVLINRTSGIITPFTNILSSLGHEVMFITSMEEFFEKVDEIATWAEGVLIDEDMLEYQNNNMLSLLKSVNSDLTIVVTTTDIRSLELPEGVDRLQIPYTTYDILSSFQKM